MYKAKLKGITVEETEEKLYISRLSILRGKHHAKGRRFICSVHKTEIHRDVNGAQNIARKKYAMDIQPLYSVVYKQPVWYKRFLSEEQNNKQNTPMINRKKKKVSPVGWRSRHRPCPLERVSFSQELLTKSSASASSDGRW